MKLAYNPSDRPALTGVSSDNKDIIFDLSGIAIYARGVKFDGKTPTVFKKHTSANTGGYDGLVPAPSYADSATRFLREDGTWETPDKTASIHWDNIDGKPDVFNPSQHIHTTNDIQSLTNYTKATGLEDLTTSDTLNVALGKLEYKSDLGVTAYNWYKSVTDEDTDEHINKWNEIVDFLNGITDTTLNGILTNFVNDLEVTGSGNAVTDVSKANNKITVTKGNSFLPLSGGTLTGKVTTSARIAMNGSILEFRDTDGSFKAFLQSYEVGNLSIYDGSRWNTIIHSGNIGSQSVASAAKLTTARSIWGQLFDGTGDIDGNITISNGNSINIGTGTYTLSQIYSTKSVFYIEARKKTNSSTGTNVPIYIGWRGGDYPLAIAASGNVGIGTTSPQAKLDVEGTLFNRGLHYIYNGADRTYRLCMAWNRGTACVYSIKADGSSYNSLRLGTTADGNRQLYYDSSTGNWGVGTSTPQYKLEVNGTLGVRGTAYCTLPSANADAFYYSERTDLGKTIGFGIGTSNNRGIYDNNLGWIFKVDPDNAITIGNGNNVGFNGSIIASGFIKSGSSSAYVLTGDGGHKLISDFATVGSLKYTDTSHITTKVVLDDFLEKYTFKVRTWNGNTAEDQLGTSYPGAQNGIILSGGWTAATYGFQLAIDDDPNWFIALRQRGNGTWSAWKRIPMGDGTGASGTWGINITGSSSSCTGNAATATSATSANYSRNLLGRNTSGTDYGAVDGNLVFAEWNTYNDSRWYLKAKGYETRVGYANNSDKLDGIDSTGFLRYYNSNTTPSNVNIVNTPSYVWTVSTTGGTATTATKPSGMDNAWGVIHLHTHVGNYATQLGFGGTTGRMYMRNAYDSSTFGSWQALAFTSDIPTSLPANGGNADTVDNMHASQFVYKNNNNIAYSDLAAYYTGSTSPGYYRIVLPDSVLSIWNMLTIELTVNQSYSNGYAGKILIYCHNNGSNTFPVFNATCLGTLTSSIKIYGSGGKYIYIEGCSSWGTVSIDKILVGDVATGKDQSGTRIDTVSALPSTYQSASMRYNIDSGNIGSQSVNYASSAGSSGSCSGNANGLASTGYGNGNLTYYQTDGSFFGNSGWSHYIIANHGNGSNYYNYTIALPFWGVPKYKRLEGGTADGWHTFITSENISSQSVNYASSAGNANTVDGYHIAVQSSAGTDASTIYFVI